MLDLLIRNGDVVTPQGVGRWVSRMNRSRTLVSMILCCRLGRTIDAAGKIVVPGGVEPHAHLDIFDLTNPDSGKSTLDQKKIHAGWLLAEPRRTWISVS